MTDNDLLKEALGTEKIVVESKPSNEGEGKNPKEEPKQEKPEDKPDDVLDFNVILKDKYKTKEELEAILERATKYNPDIEKELLSEKEQKKLLMEENEWFKKLHGDGDESEIRLTLLKRKDSQKAKIASKILDMGDIKETQTQLDLMRLKIKSDNPEFQRPDVILKKKYPLLTDPEADKDSDEYAAEQYLLIQDTKSARAELMKEYNEIEVPKKLSKEEREKEKQAEETQKTGKVQALRDEWKSALNEIPKVIEYEDADGEKYEFTDIPKEKILEYKKEFFDGYILPNGFKMDEKLTEVMNQFVKNRYKNDNEKEFIQKIKEQIQENTDKKKFNPSSNTAVKDKVSMSMDEHNNKQFGV